MWFINYSIYSDEVPLIRRKMLKHYENASILCKYVWNLFFIHLTLQHLIYKHFSVNYKTRIHSEEILTYNQR